MVTSWDKAPKEGGFTFVSGDVSLDFAGTLRFRRTVREELLVGPEDLSRWFVQAGVLDEEVPVDATAYARAVELREAVYALAEAKIVGRRFPEAERVLVNTWAQRPRVALQLDVSGRIRRSGGALEALGTTALTAVRLIGSDVTLRQCGADHCTRIFVDRSRKHDRKWCEMSGCGNRDKARAYRRRRAGSGAKGL
jgi:predicted RNA-binding Zn ribbon-like protein